MTSAWVIADKMRTGPAQRGQRSAWTSQILFSKAAQARRKRLRVWAGMATSTAPSVGRGAVGRDGSAAAMALVRSPRERFESHP
jgi:hypothetical protein